MAVRTGRGRAVAAVILVGAALVLGLNTETGRLLTGRWSFTKSVEVDRGTYFRLQVKVAYMGEPVDFNIVVGCNVRRIGYKDGSNTTEVGMAPVVFGKRMPDNKGLVVRAPDACSARYIKEGWIPDDLLPVMVVYDDADTLAFGTAYMSEDAYQNPLSLLRFDSAKITAATRQEFDVFRKEQTNLVGRNAFYSAQMGVELLRPRGLELAIPFGGGCYTYQRFRIPEDLRGQIRKAWPSDRPRYWWPGYTSPFNPSTMVQSDVGGEFQRLGDWGGGSEYFADKGVRRRNGGGLIQPPRNRWPRPVASYFPGLSDRRADKWPVKMAEWPNFVKQRAPFVGEKIDFRNGDTRGFAYCYTIPTGDPGMLNVDQQLEIQGVIAIAPATRKVDDMPIAGAPKIFGDGIYIFIEGDEFFLE